MDRKGIGMLALFTAVMTADSQSMIVPLVLVVVSAVLILTGREQDV